MIADLLQNIPIFQTLPESEIRYLAENLTRQEYPDGTLVVREGHPASRFHILLEGEVEIIKAIGTADERLLAVRKAGTLIGEMGLLSEEGLHTATVRAKTPIYLLQMTQEEFDALLHRHPSLAYGMVRTLSQRLNHSENLTIRDLRRKNMELMQAYKELEAAQAELIIKERLERELEVARDIQENILPRALPDQADYDFGSLMVPMSAVGGDFYDFIPLGEDRLGIAIGDVSDHGVPAALFMAITVTLLRAEARRIPPPTPKEILLNVNKHLLETNETGIFVTMLYGELDYNKRLFSYVRAGHEIPIICNAQGDLSDLPQGKGQLMGILEKPVLDENRMQLYHGCTLLMFTDGVNEAANDEGDLFGHERLRQDLAALRRSSAQDVCMSILKNVEAFRGGNAQQDDITMVAVAVR
jgi:sigma-B regulation protein RsbU (phosphoserine phosphatase)